MKFTSLLILLCAPLLSMEVNNKIVPKSLDPNVWINTLKMVGNCGNLSQTISKWNQFCNEHFDVLYNNYVSSFVEVNPDYKYEMVQGPFPGLLMVKYSKFLGVTDAGNGEGWIVARPSKDVKKNFKKPAAFKLPARFKKRFNKNELRKLFYYGIYKDEEAAAHMSDKLAIKFRANGENGHRLNFPYDDTVHPKGIILDLDKTVVSFRFQNRDFALKKIKPNIYEQTIDFVYNTIGKRIKDGIIIRYKIMKLPMDGLFFAPDDTEISVYMYSSLSRNEINITTSCMFMDADVEPRFAPEFAQTLLKKQQNSELFL